MRFRGFNQFIISGIIFSGLILLAFVLLQWLQLPIGHFIDWLIGLAMFWWLLVIVTFPWNIHFQARTVVVEAARSEENGIAVKPKQVAYANLWVKRSLVAAIALHLISAIGLYIVAVSGISAIGYIGSGAALLLTGLRPAARAYEYIVGQLAAIQREFHYPREDVVKLRQTVEQVSKKVETLQKELDREDKQSWAARQDAHIKSINREMERVHLTQNKQHTANQTDHARLSREAEQAIAQITADGQFLDHVREIIRFVKSA